MVQVLKNVTPYGLKISGGVVFTSGNCETIKISDLRSLFFSVTSICVLTKEKFSPHLEYKNQYLHIIRKIPGASEDAQTGG